MTRDKPSIGMTLNKSEYIFTNELYGFDEAENFHESSIIHPALIPRGSDVRFSNIHDGHFLAPTIKRSTKSYPDAEHVKLTPSESLEAKLSDCLSSRISNPPREGVELSFEDLSDILYYSYGVNKDRMDGDKLFWPRYIPSGGALYPNDVYIIVFRVDGLSQGCYYYNSRANIISLVKKKLPEEALFVHTERTEHPCIIGVITSTFWRNKLKYGNRGYRFSLIESGHIMQNISLCAAAKEVNCLPVGGFFDDRVNLYLDINGVDEAALYCFLLG